MNDRHNGAVSRREPVAHERENLLLIDEIEMVCRLVEQQKARILRKKLRELDSDVEIKTIRGAGYALEERG